MSPARVAALFLPLALLVGACGDDEAEKKAADGPASTATIESKKGISVDLSYDKVGLTAVFRVPKDVDLHQVKSLYIAIGVSDDGKVLDYGLQVVGSKGKPRVNDGEDNTLLCQERFAIDSSAGTLTATFPTVCASEGDPQDKGPLLENPLHVDADMGSEVSGTRRHRSASAPHHGKTVLTRS